MEYKIGDRVRFIGRSLTVPRGEMGVVKGFAPSSQAMALELDHETSYHSCNGATKPYRGWWVYESEIELIKPAEREFKLIIVSKGDVTTAKLLHGKTVEKEATVTRYHEDEYNGRAAIDAVVKKLFGEDKKEEEPKYFTGRAVWIGGSSQFLSKGRIYTFADGVCEDDAGRKHRLVFTEEGLRANTGFLPIVE